MEYVYLSLPDELLRHFKKLPSSITDETNSLEISLNIDGLPLFKSSNKTLWPVLCAIANVEPIVVFPVVLTYGSSKPKDLEFLEDIVKDLGHILEHGLQDGDRVLQISLRCVVCDAPARALVRGTKLCSGYFGCDKCAQKGVWEGRVVYPLVKDINLRTDVSFRGKVNAEHHNNESPFCALPINMVKTFPIDYMHQLCLGVMKKLILSWIRGSRDVKLSAGQVKEISDQLIALKPFMPNIFARKPRGLEEIDRWKATEYRQFLLYTGKAVLHNVLNPELYNHFLCLNVASSIMISPTLASVHCAYAKQLMEYFVEQGIKLYGKEFPVYNVHSMIHLADDVAEYGSLDACSAFPFENYMQKLKRLVRSGKNPLVQIAKRLSESTEAVQPCHEPKICLKRPDNAFILTDSACCEVVQKLDYVDHNGNEQFSCRVYQRTEALFVNPCDSRLAGVFKANARWTTMKVLSSQALTRNAIKFELGPSKIVFMAILHRCN